MLYSSTVIQEQQKNHLLKAEEIATMLGLKVQTVYAMARRGELQKVKLSRRCLRFRAGEVEDSSSERRIHDGVCFSISGYIGNIGHTPLFSLGYARFHIGHSFTV